MLCDVLSRGFGTAGILFLSLSGFVWRPVVWDVLSGGFRVPGIPLVRRLGFFYLVVVAVVCHVLPGMVRAQGIPLLSRVGFVLWPKPWDVLSGGFRVSGCPPSSSFRFLGGGRWSVTCCQMGLGSLASPYISFGVCEALQLCEVLSGAF